MKTIAVVMSLAFAGIALSSDFAPAFASKMDGKCCASSDGGRSARHKWVMSRRAIPHTCSAYAASCLRDSRSRADAVPMCRAARMQCLRTGVHVGPYSGMRYARMEKR